MATSRPISLTLYLIFTWLTKILLMLGGLYFIKYVSARIDFYIGIGLHDVRPQQYILLGGNVVVLAGTVGMFLMRKWGFRLYLVGKVIEAVALFWAWPFYSGAFTHALRGIDSAAFSVTFLCMLICLTTIFPLIYLTYSRKFR